MIQKSTISALALGLYLFTLAPLQASRRSDGAEWNQNTTSPARWRGYTPSSRSLTRPNPVAPCSFAEVVPADADLAAPVSSAAGLVTLPAAPCQYARDETTPATYVHQSIPPVAAISSQQKETESQLTGPSEPLTGPG